MNFEWVEKVLEANEEYVAINLAIKDLGKKISRTLDKEQLKLFLEYESKMADLENCVAEIVYNTRTAV